MFRKQIRRWLLLAMFGVVFVVLVANTRWWELVFKFAFPGQPGVLFPNVSLLSLVGEHLKLVVISSSLTILIGFPLGVWVTRRIGRSFLAIVNDFTSFSQAVPPVAVLALAVPLFGFGLVPTVVALFLYGLLPVVRNTIAGLRAIPGDVLETAYAMGMSKVRTFWLVEMPLAARVILAGVRVSVIINVGTAMIGAVIGAGGLGSPVIAGLVQFNTAFVLEGAVPAALLVILIDQLFAGIEKTFAYSAG